VKTRDSRCRLGGNLAVKRGREGSTQKEIEGKREFCQWNVNQCLSATSLRKKFCCVAFAEFWGVNPPTCLTLSYQWDDVAGSQLWPQFSRPFQCSYNRHLDPLEQAKEQNGRQLQSDEL
jgi:hypothetical protein